MSKAFLDPHLRRMAFEFHTVSPLNLCLTSSPLKSIIIINLLHKYFVAFPLKGLFINFKNFHIILCLQLKESTEMNIVSARVIFTSLFVTDLTCCLFSLM